MRARGLIGGAVAMACLAVGPTAAEAAKFCVKKPKCVQAGGTGVPTLGAAIASANANGAGRDRIELGAKEFDDGPWAAAAGNPINLVGAGRDKTTLRRLGTSNGVTILNLGDPGSRVAELKVAVNTGVTVTGILTPGRIERVRVNAATPMFQTGVALTSGGVLLRSRVAMPVAGDGIAVNLVGDNVRARNNTLRAGTGVTGGGFTEPAVATRTRITAGDAGVLASANLILDQGTIRIISPTGGEGLHATSSSGLATVVARHVTIVGPGTQDSYGALATVLAIVPATCPVARLSLRNSIIRGFGTHLFRSDTSPGCSEGTASATINVAWSVFNPLSVFESGNGSTTSGNGNRNVNPRFVKQAKGNYRLKASSPMIDKGQPGKPKAGESKRDLDGRKRVLDGDGNGKARRDVGAFERKRKR